MGAMSPQINAKPTMATSVFEQPPATNALLNSLWISFKADNGQDWRDRLEKKNG